MAAGAWSWHSFGHVCTAPWGPGPCPLLFCLQQLRISFAESPAAACKKGRRLCHQAILKVPCYTVLVFWSLLSLHFRAAADH